MKKLIILSFMLLSACIEEGSDQTSSMIVICLDGVQYWNQNSGASRVMAPRIDPNTMTFVRCEEK